jgi:WhiB family redox-sensing transcriptional regulator
VIDDSWMIDALCRGTKNPDIFYPDTSQGKMVDIRNAKRLCLKCEVRTSCLFYSIAHREKNGVWGGLSERQRSKLPKPLKVKIKRLWDSKYPLHRIEVRRGTGERREKA